MGRQLSPAVHGWPDRFQVVLTMPELALPPVHFLLTGADERVSRAREATG
ncbi:hypothetical protein [Streptomyces sp. NPDC048659]